MKSQTRDSIRFVLDGKTCVVDDVDPNRTVLQYLREDLQRTGSKEGCAEGDCGACTVVVAELHDGGMRYQAINSCIQFLPTLDGKALFTVESLSAPGAPLHPAQQAMVECHGSQCGFCTPGFVMSLFALYKDGPHPGRRGVDDALAGNLCRCTGYRPIIDAAQRMYELGEHMDSRGPGFADGAGRQCHDRTRRPRGATALAAVDRIRWWSRAPGVPITRPAASRRCWRSPRSIPMRPCSPAAPTWACG